MKKIGEWVLARRELRRKYSASIAAAGLMWSAAFLRGSSSVMGLISDSLLFAIALLDTGCVLFLLVCYVFSLLKEIYRFAAATGL